MVLASGAAASRLEAWTTRRSSRTSNVSRTRSRSSDPGEGDVAAWLDGIARRLLVRAQHRGRVDDRARRRLGMASLEPGETFAGELEEELVAASRFRASRRRPRRPFTRPPARVVRAALAGVAALALAAGAPRWRSAAATTRRTRGRRRPGPRWRSQRAGTANGGTEEAGPVTAVVHSARTSLSAPYRRY
jgi:hypothetical protein